ncbi:hypothetical protein P154DRAFT_607141 [Amniculicola lignicola CBS 123094]|uniref:Uncharacterized protein n=1 Tax=Amniculicola lignicola CBS 123094 TaxID=1392246 RepID=A0A6A5W7A4_9PLEO|nr:hypothetical protein P154DRAFT_607141 [Amniculicola lignicola CBS 123094]
MSIYLTPLQAFRQQWLNRGQAQANPFLQQAPDDHQSQCQADSPVGEIQQDPMGDQPYHREHVEGEHADTQNQDTASQLLHEDAHPDYRSAKEAPEDSSHSDNEAVESIDGTHTPSEEAETQDSVESSDVEDPISLAYINGSFEELAHSEQAESTIGTEGSGYQDGTSNTSETDSQHVDSLPYMKEEPDSDSDSEDDMPLMQRLGKADALSSEPTLPSAPSNPNPIVNEEEPDLEVSEDDVDDLLLAGEEKDDSDVDKEAATKISWKLPEYEALYELTPDSFPLAKISIPGLVRHEICLSPDHSEAEFHLFLHVFLPAQRTLKPRSSLDETKLDILNFHTIAVLVLDCLQIHVKLDNPKKMDVDEVFLSCMDNWRIGREAGRENYTAIRGVQEFFDVAWELVWFVKENGLGVEAGKDKKKRKAKAKAKAGASAKGGKGGVKAKANVLLGRKKTKADMAAGGKGKGKAIGAKGDKGKWVKAKEKVVQSGRVTKSKAKK